MRRNRWLVMTWMLLMTPNKARVPHGFGNAFEIKTGFVLPCFLPKSFCPEALPKFLLKFLRLDAGRADLAETEKG